MPLPGRPDLRRAPFAPSAPWGRSTVARAIAIFVALIVLLVSLSAEAKKKKKGGKKHKTPATKTTGKSTQAAPDSSADSDDDDEEEKPASSKPAAQEEEEKPPAPPPSEDDAPVKKPAKAKAPPKEEEAEGGGGLFALRMGIGGGALFRNLVWTGSNGALSPYSLSPGPQAAIWFEAYPAAFATSGFAANLGLWGRFNYGFGASSRLMNGTVLTTKYQDFLFGAKVRIPFGSFQPNLAVAYGNQAFQLTPADVTRPNFNYAFVHVGAGARVQFTSALDLDLGIAYLHVLDAGARNTEVRMIYPDTTAYGIDVGASLGFRIASLIGIRAGGNFRQFGVNTNWMPGDPAAAAAGAADRSITVFGGLEVILDGAGGGGSGESEDAPAKKPAKAKKKAPADDEAGSEAPEVKPDEAKEKEE
jgi:hypothetical protein